jgi:acetyl esterase/lipase
VDQSDPPVFLYHGSEDELVPPLHATSFQKKLAEKSVENQLEFIEGKDHIPAFLFPGDTINHAIDFLDRHLKG